MKSYTDIKQSKKLAEILSTESADMYFEPSPGFCTEPSEIRVGDIRYAHPRSIPCWSLGALLSIIRKTIGYTVYGTNNVYISCKLGDKPWEIETKVYDNEVDACYEMILNLHKQNLI